MKLKRFDELNEAIGRSTRKYEDEPSFFSRYKDDDKDDNFSGVMASHFAEGEDNEDDNFSGVMASHFAGSSDFDEPVMSGFEIKGYNQAIDDILLLISQNKIKGIERTIPPEALIHVFKKLKK